MTEDKALLPTGMMDQMPDRAEQEFALCGKIQSVFASFGYRLVNPPLLEFEETLLAEGAGKALAANTFRLMDPVSRRMMALRSDTTAQIARLAASRMSDAPRPLRLAYIADVLRINASQTRPERQFKQAGCEVVGDINNASAEIALLALLSLSESGVENITIDFTAPEIIRNLISGNTLRKDKIMAAALRKDHEAFKELGETGNALAALDNLSGLAENFLTLKNKTKLPAAVSKILDELGDLIKDLQKTLKIYGLEKNVTITVDPLEMRGFEYQDFPCFTLFSRGHSGELGRGGAYVSAFGKHKEKACGFTLYLDSVMRAIPKMKPDKYICVDEKKSWRQIRDLQAAGFKVIRGGAGIAHGATHKIKDGKAEKI